MTALTLDYLLARRIAVLGVGINNQALVAWLLKHKAESVTICDQNPAVRLDNPAWEQKVAWRLGADAFSHLTDFELVIRSPGIPYLSPFIQQAKAAGVEISSQTKLFFALSPAKIIGVTGTKGKGTTASLIFEILKANSLQTADYGESRSPSAVVHQPNIFLAGNIGRDPFEFLDDLTPLDWVVLELSSFQLQDMEQSPEIAVILDITSDHLDHHRDRAEYVAAKVPIVAHLRPEQAAVFNFDSDTVLGMVSQT
ncbi:MAG: Mur ligase family protein, partial [Patescibacteria group bacterium]